MNLSTLLLVLFIGLKLAGIIHWSWLWVLCPFWIWAALWCAIVIIAYICDAVSK